MASRFVGVRYEVMLAAIECRGVVDAVRQFAGMFAFALFDRQNGYTVTRAGRLGEKPLYYGWTGRTLLFGSELKACGRIPNGEATSIATHSRCSFATTTSCAPFDLSGYPQGAAWHDAHIPSRRAHGRATRGRLLVSACSCGKWRGQCGRWQRG